MKQRMFDDNEAVVENPSFAHHCAICGGHENWNMQIDTADGERRVR